MMDTSINQQNGPRGVFSNRLKVTAIICLVFHFVLFDLRSSVMITNYDFATTTTAMSLLSASSLSSPPWSPSVPSSKSSSSSSLPVQSAKGGLVQTVSCNELVEETYPNQTSDEIQRKLFLRETNKGPQFWISVHNKEYDPVRWSIMEWGHYYERLQSAAFVEILQNSSSPRVIDVGGNIGWFSLLSAQVGAKVDVFEPNKQNYLRMCESICLNGWVDESSSCSRLPILLQNATNNSSSSSPLPPRSGRVHVHPHGVGSKFEKVFFTTSSSNNPGAGHVITPTVNNSNRLEMEGIQLVSLDLVASERGWYNETIDIMKLDVEGYELHVIHGAMTLLRSHIIQNIFMEGNVGHKKNMDIFLEIAEALFNAGYIPYKIGGFRGPTHIIEEKLSGFSINEASSSSNKNVTSYASELMMLCKGGKNAKRPRQQCNLWWQLSAAVTTTT